jgi:hypothetical protein
MTMTLQLDLFKGRSTRRGMRHRVKNAPNPYRGTMVDPERERKVIRVKSIRFAGVDVDNDTCLRVA